MKTVLKIALASGALLAAAVLPASAQGFGFGFSTGNGYDRFSGYYSDYGRSYRDPYHYGYYSQPYYGGRGYGWRHRLDWDDRGWHHGWRRDRW